MEFIGFIGLKVEKIEHRAEVCEFGSGNAEIGRGNDPIADCLRKAKGKRI